MGVLFYFSRPVNDDVYNIRAKDGGNERENSIVRCLVFRDLAPIDSFAPENLPNGSGMGS